MLMSIGDMKSRHQRRISRLEISDTHLVVDMDISLNQLHGNKSVLVQEPHS